jgi:hypothetical protein
MKSRIAGFRQGRLGVLLASVVIAAAGVPSALGQPPAVLEALPGLAPTVPDRVDSGFDVTDSGYVVGISSNSVAPYRGVVWTPAGGVVDIGADPDYPWTYCTSVSDGANVFAGFGIPDDGSFTDAWIRKPPNPIQRLEDSLTPTEFGARSTGDAVSGDGTRIWGTRTFDGSQWNVRVWNTSTLSFTDIPSFASNSSDFVVAASRNGAIAAGTSYVPSSNLSVATRMSISGIAALPRLTQIGGDGNAIGMTSSGNAVVGVQGTSENNLPFIWKAGVGTKPLPRLLASSTTAFPLGIADNGVIVGHETKGEQFTALIWFGGRCFSLRSYLQSQYGVSFAGWSQFRGANAISPNGRYITGAGIFNGERRVFRVRFTGNRAPVANAGPDVRVRANGRTGANVKLNGAQSADPDGTPVQFWWSGARFIDRTLSRPTAKFPVGTTTVLLQVSDGSTFRPTDSVRVVVLAPRSKIRPDGLAANESFASTSSLALASTSADGAGAASLRAAASAATAESIGAALGDAIVWDEDDTEADATVAYAELRNLQAAHGQVALASLAQAYAETGDPSALAAAIKAQAAVLYAVADCGDRR